MKNKCFSFILSFTVITVAAAAINCGCAFADMSRLPVKSQAAASSHCDSHENESTQASSEDKCCTECRLELGVLNPSNPDFQPAHTRVFRTFETLFTGLALPGAVKDPALDSSWQDSGKRGVSAPVSGQPIFIAVRSLRI